jgi:uncharacterized membrane protein YidH (DUF202 family)
VQKLLSDPVVAPFFFVFGIVLAQLGYGYLQRGSFQYSPQNGPTQVISPTSNPMLYWSVSAGMLALGALFLVLSAYAAFYLVRAYRAEGARRFRPSAFGVFMFALGLIVMITALLAGTCSHR